MRTLRLVGMIILVLGVVAAPIATEAQPAGKVYRIGFLSVRGPEQETLFWAPFRDFLRERGWTEGQNLVFERRYAEGNYERLPDLAAELVRLKPDVLVTWGGPATSAAKRATTAIPIVMWDVTDPVGIGLVQSLARPGGNVTGLSDDQAPEIVGKRLELLKRVAPTVSRVALLTRVFESAAIPRLIAYDNAYEAAAAALGLQFRKVPLEKADDIDKAFTAIVREGVGALDVAYVAITWIHRRQIMDLALRHRLPAIYAHRVYALDGGLMTYGVDDRDVPRRLGGYLDRILRGARPADLPVEQPTRFELVINLKTAKALGLTIPPAVLQQADEVIE